MQDEERRQEQRAAQAAQRAAEKQQREEERKRAVKARAHALRAEGAAAASSSARVRSQSAPDPTAAVARSLAHHSAAQSAAGSWRIAVVLTANNHFAILGAHLGGTDPCTPTTAGAGAA